MRLMDLAGLDEALAHRSAPDEAAQRAAWEAIERADVLVVCDQAARFEIAGVPAVSLARGRPVIRVRTMADAPARASNKSGLPVCAIDGWNLGPLRQEIVEAAHRNASAASDARGAMLRRGFVLDRARLALEEAAAIARTPARGASEGRALIAPERIASAMRSALDHLGELTGRIARDDIIGRIFASFCVGK